VQQARHPHPFAWLAPRGICAMQVVPATSSVPPVPSARPGVIVR
jgi:hypothetical protein